MPAPEVTSYSHLKAGRRFEPIHELTLLDGAVGAARRIPGFDGESLLLAELPGPIGIPDLTVVLGSAADRTRRLNSGIPPILNRLDASILASLPVRGSRSADAISRKLCWPQHVVERRIKHLLGRDAVKQGPRSGFAKNPQMVPVGDIFVLEAKVSNWQRALAQARAYSVWSNGYVLVLGAMSCQVQGRVMAEIGQDRGGLFVGGEWIRLPRKHLIPSANKLWASEHVVAALIHQKPSTAP